MEEATVINKNKSLLIKKNICTTRQGAHAKNEQRGASILEVLLSLAIVAVLAPFAYGQITEISAEIRDIASAKQIIELRGPALNFVRMHQEDWPDFAQIKLSDEELLEITEYATAGFIDKYLVKGFATTDIYLSFDLGIKDIRAAKIAKHIGQDAATVSHDGIAYANSWAAAAPEFRPGNLVYRISRDFNADDQTKYLHLGTDGEDELNVMLRTLNMGKNDMYDVGTLASESAKASDTFVAFAQAKEIATSSTYFTKGATMDGRDISIGTMRIAGDITGFRNINTNRLNTTGFSTSGDIIADRASVTNAVYVGKNMNIKSSSERTISGFSGLVTHVLFTPYLYSDEMFFFNNFGLTVSGELLMSSTQPIKIGSWYFPSNTPPKFAEVNFSRTDATLEVNSAGFDKIIKSGWKELKRIEE